MRTPRGWLVHHQDRLSFKANAGAPTLRLKFYHYPLYRQQVEIRVPPQGCTLKAKGLNAYFLYVGQVPTRGTLSFERIVAVTPQPSLPPKEYGEISTIPTDVARKYKQSHPYWPLNSKVLQSLASEHWFKTDSLREWLREVSEVIPGIINRPEPQDKRWGAEEVIRTGVGDCDEFTDLFITLARIRGIPSRRLTGYFIPNNSLIPEGHAWAECLAPTAGWIPVDLAQHNIGVHSSNYIIQKIEEFNPALNDFQIQQQSALLHVTWDRPTPTLTPL